MRCLEKYLAIVAAVLAVSLFAACGSGSTGGDTTTEAAEESTTASDTTEESTTASETTDASSGDADATDGPTSGVDSSDTVSSDGTIDTEATVRLAYAIAPARGLDPHLSQLAYDLTWLGPVYDALVLELSNGELAPGLATAWTFTDDTTLDLTLRDGVTFHDGAEFDAEVVKQNLERAQTLEGSTAAGQLRMIESIEVTGPLSVRLNLSTPSATLPRVLADRPGMMISPASLDDPDLAGNPVGAGRFRVVEYDPGASAVYERFDDYWRPEDVQFRRLEITAQSDSLTRWNAVRSGQSDITHVDAAEFIEAESSEFQTLEIATTIGMFLQLNRTRSEFGDVRVRQAMNLAIDRDAIAESLYLGKAIGSPQFFPPNYALGHVSEVEEDYAVDLERARALLAEAGLPDGFAFESAVPSIPAFNRLAEVLQSQLAQIGIEMTLTGVTPGAGGNVFYVDQTIDAIVAAYQGTTDPAITAQLYFSPTALTNPGGHVPDGMDEALAEALLPGEEDERRAGLQELMSLAVTEAGNVNLLQLQQLIVTKPELIDVDWSVRGMPTLRGLKVAGS